MPKRKGIINEAGRTCTKCGEFKAWGEFNRDKKGINGKASRCSECKKNINKKYYEENRDVLLEYNKQYREDNRDSILESKRQYYEENRDAILAQKKDYYKENRDIILETKKEYREENKAIIAERNKHWREENRDIIADYQKQYREENRDIIAERNKHWREENHDVLLKKKKEYSNSSANYETYKDNFTPTESPRESKDGYLEVKCATCREYFIPTNQQVQNRIKALNGILSGEHRLYCSDSCKTSCSVYNQKKYPKDLTKPIKREYSKEFREMILERDEYTCQVCGERFDSKELQAHHINPVICSPMEQVDIENGICVCKECHNKLHDQDGCRFSDLAKIL
jgi:hypothetical protein